MSPTWVGKLVPCLICKFNTNTTYNTYSRQQRYTYNTKKKIGKKAEIRCTCEEQTVLSTHGLLTHQIWQFDEVKLSDLQDLFLGLYESRKKVVPHYSEPYSKSYTSL